MKWIFGSPVWEEDGWRLPPGFTAMVDVRTIGDMGPPSAGQFQAVFFAAPDAVAVPRGYRLLSSDAIDAGQVALSDREFIRDALGIDFLPADGSVYHVIRDLLGERSDPANGRNPLMPGRQLRYVLHLGGESVAWDWQSTGDHYDRMRHVIRENYKQVRAAAIRGDAPADLYLKYLGDQTRKYFGDSGDARYREFQDAGVPDERPRRPATTVSDDFNRADESLDAGNWVEVDGNWSVTSNQARNTAGVGGYAVAQYDGDLSSDDHYSECQIFSNANGPTARQAASLTFYLGFLGVLGSSATHSVRKSVSGSETTIASASATVASGSVMRLTVGGSSLELFDDGASIVTGTDSSITGNLRAGMWCAKNATRDFDNFEAADSPFFDATATLVLGGLETTATATYTLPPPGTYTGAATLTFGGIETTTVGIAGLHYPNSATTYDIADLDPFYESFNRYDWTNELDARFDDSTYTHVTLNPAQGGYTYVLEVSNYGFELPPHSKVNGIKVEIKRRKTGTSVDTDWSINDVVVQLAKSSGSVVGTNKWSGTEYPLSHTYATYGGPTDLWGASWTAAEVNATGFGVAFASVFTNNSADFDGTVEVDAIRTTVYFTPPHAGIGQLVFGNLFTTAAGFTLPKRTGTAALVLGGLDTTEAGTFVEPVYTATFAKAFGGVDIAATATFSGAPVYLAAAAVTFAGIETTAAGATLPKHTASGAVTFAAFDTTTAGIVLRPVFAGSIATVFKRFQTTATAAFVEPVYDGQATLAFSEFSLSAVADFNPPLGSGAATQAFGGLESTGAATFVEPVYEGAAALSFGGLATGANAQFIEQQFVEAIAGVFMPALDFSGAALQIDPVYAGEGSFLYGGLVTSARSVPLRGIHFHAGILDSGDDPMSLGAVVETDYTFIEGYRETVKIEFVERLGADLFVGTPAVTEIGKRSVDIDNPRVNSSLENIDGIFATPGQALLCDVEVTAAKKQPTVLRFDCDTNNPVRSFVVDFVFHTRR